MCGVAGYNLKPEFVLETFSEDKQELLLQEAWLRNLHRGYDGAGFFSWTPEQKFHTFKSDGDAVKILTEKIYGQKAVPLAHVLAAHTRDPSYGSGASSTLSNVHPVSWDNVFVTHNGTIENDYPIKKIFKELSGSEWVPTVDSVAIAMVLSEVSDPTSMDEIASALNEVWGKMVIHAAWNDMPGYSLLARGFGRPLIVAYNPDVGVVYSSEDDGVWSLIDKLGFDPNDDSWSWNDMDSETMFTVKDGVPVGWGTFNFREQSSNRSEFGVERWLPTDPPQLVYETDVKSDFAVRRFGTASIADMPVEKLEKSIVYDRDEKYVSNDLNSMPVDSDLKMLAVASEVDYIYKIDKEFHLIVNNVEIVVNEYRSIKDLFYHDKFKMKDRFASRFYGDEVRAENDKLQKVDFETFLVKKSMLPPDIPQTGEDYKYVADMKKKNKKVKGDSGKVFQLPIRKKEPVGGTSTDGDDSKVNWPKPKKPLTWDNIHSIVHHEKSVGLAWIHEGECPAHGVDFSVHPDVVKCEHALVAASFTYAACESIDLYTVIDNINARISWETSETWCDLKGPDRCWFTPTEFITISWKDSKWNMVTAETCFMCYTRRRLDMNPWYFHYLTHSDRWEKEVVTRVG